MTPTDVAPMVASLAMYPFLPLRQVTDSLWSVVQSHLGWGPTVLEWDVVTPEVWSHPDLLVAQTCGWPLVTRLADRMAVVGTFDYDVPGASGGNYQSVLISREAVPFDVLRSRPGVVAARNASDSLSGGVSLNQAWDGVPPLLVETGAHVESVRAVADGRADVASIDAVSWALIGSLEPELVRSLSVVGSGPLVPCLPVVVPLRYAHHVSELRSAFTAAVADPAAADACAALRIRGFVPLDLEDYLPLLSLRST